MGKWGAVGSSRRAGTSSVRIRKDNELVQYLFLRQQWGSDREAGAVLVDLDCTVHVGMV